MRKHIHIVGASGSGTTTLGKMLSLELGYEHIDTDDYYWIKTDPPYTTPRPVDERIKLLKDKLERTDKWIISGSLVGWGDQLMPYFDLVVFLWIPQELRIARLHEREALRYGDGIKVGGKMHDQFRTFIDWAAQYDTGDETIRSRTLHETWLKGLDCNVLRLEGIIELEDRIQQVKKEL